MAVEFMSSQKSRSVMAFSLKLLFIALFAIPNPFCGNKNIIYKASTSKLCSQSISKNGFNKELIITIGEDSIAGYALIANGDTPKETVILIQGYPGNDNNFDIAQEIRGSGKNAILFNHRGAWGSQGLYTYSNCLDDIQYVINYLSQKEMAESLRININKFTLIGRSYGGGIALITGSQIPVVKKIIAISSVNYGPIMEKYNSVAELDGFKRYMRKQFMMKHNIDDFLQELLDNKEEFNILTYSEELKYKQVLFIEDSNKNEDWIKQIEDSEYIVIESDHNFVNERKELVRVVLDWL